MLPYEGKAMKNKTKKTRYKKMNRIGSNTGTSQRRFGWPPSLCRLLPPPQPRPTRYRTQNFTPNLYCCPLLPTCCRKWHLKASSSSLFWFSCCWGRWPLRNVTCGLRNWCRHLGGRWLWTWWIHCKKTYSWWFWSGKRYKLRQCRTPSCSWK